MRTTLALATLCLLAAPALANETLQGQVPNGATLGCFGCHPFGSALNDFSRQMSAAANVWLDFCDLDADGDGHSNGAELGDPDCVWAVGQQPASPTIYAPADPAVFPGPEPADDGVPPDLGDVQRDDAGRPLDDAGNPIGDAAPDPAPTGDAVSNLDEDCTATPGAPAAPPIALALLTLIALTRRRRP